MTGVQTCALPISARSVAIALIAGTLTEEQLDPAWLSERRAEIEELAGRVRVRHDWDSTLETLRGPVDAGASTADVGPAGWLRVVRRLRELHMPDVLGPSELRRLLSRGDLRRDLWRLARRRGGGLEALDTEAMQMSFPCRLRIRLRSGRVLELEGGQWGSCGRPLEEQRRVVEEKCRLVGLEQPIAAA